MAETVLKIFIIIMFLAMEEIPYILKIIGLAVIGITVIIDWYTFNNEEKEKIRQVKALLLKHTKEFGNVLRRFWKAIIPFK